MSRKTRGIAKHYMAVASSPHVVHIDDPLTVCRMVPWWILVLHISGFLTWCTNAKAENNEEKNIEELWKMYRNLRLEKEKSEQQEENSILNSVRNENDNNFQSLVENLNHPDNSEKVNTYESLFVPH